MDDFIIFNQKKYFIRNNTIKLTSNEINSLLEIEDLFKFKKLLGLHLQNNNILTFKGVEEFPDLTILDLTENKIEKISNLENNIKLKKLYLRKN
ncbi:MAG: hypothetical protein JW891_16270, partial [Candidatus Lokiarchaeota archaeon]|nr:hypothetical protein [Candidatus Lokiarchaeota archaeon]